MNEYKEPTELGWYRYVDGGAGLMVFSLRRVYEWDEEKTVREPVKNQWRVHIYEGDSDDCEFRYIDQAGPIERIYP